MSLRNHHQTQGKEQTLIPQNFLIYLCDLLLTTLHPCSWTQIMTDLPRPHPITAAWFVSLKFIRIESYEMYIFCLNFLHSHHSDSSMNVFLFISFYCVVAFHLWLCQACLSCYLLMDIWVVPALGYLK